MCPLQIINDIEPLSSTVYGVNSHLFTTHPMSKITRSAISRKPINQKKKKNGVLENIFLHLYTGFELKNQNTNGRKSSLNFFNIHKICT